MQVKKIIPTFASTKQNNMKSFYIYITLIAFSAFTLWVAFTWNIPVDNQIGMAFVGVLAFVLVIVLAIYETNEYYKEKNNTETF